MRDHPSHSQYATNSGTRGAIPNMHSLLLMQRQRNRHTENMTFLNTVVWMKAKSFFITTIRFRAEITVYTFHSRQTCCIGVCW
jgi:hypothetical protein